MRNWRRRRKQKLITTHPHRVHVFMIHERKVLTGERISFNEPDFVVDIFAFIISSFFFPPRLFFSLCISLALLITFTSHSCARVLRSSKLFGITNTSRDAALLFFPYNVIATSVGSRSDTAARTARRAHSRSSKKLLYFSRLTCAIEEK